MRTEPGELIRETDLKMAKENAFVLAGDPLPPIMHTRGIRLEIHADTGEARHLGSQDARRTGVRGRDSHTAGVRINVEELRRNRKIERLEEELHELKGAHKGFEKQWSRRQRSRSHSGSCESSHRFPRRQGRDHRNHRNSR